MILSKNARHKEKIYNFIYIVRMKNLSLYPLMFNDGKLQIKQTKERFKRFFKKCLSIFLWSYQRNSQLGKWLKLEVYIPNLVEKGRRRKGFYGNNKQVSLAKINRLLEQTGNKKLCLCRCQWSFSHLHGHETIPERKFMVA